MTNWKKLTDGEDFEKRNKWIHEEMPEMEGVLIEKKENVGTYNQNLFAIKTDNGDEYDIWSTTVLTKYLIQVPVGSAVKIIYKGKKKSKNGMSTYKDFDVFVGGVVETTPTTVNTSESSGQVEEDELPF